MQEHRGAGLDLSVFALLRIGNGYLFLADGDAPILGGSGAVVLSDYAVERIHNAAKSIL